MDRRLTVALDGGLLFDPIDYDDPAGRPRPFDESPSRSACRGARSRSAT